MVAKLFSLPGNVSGAVIDAFKFSLVSFPVVESWVWVSRESEGDVAFSLEVLVIPKARGPPGHSEAKVRAVGMARVSVVSEEVLRVRMLPADPSPEEGDDGDHGDHGDERAREELVLLTLSALVAAGLSVVDIETAELGSVLSVVLRGSVVSEEMTVWTESVLIPDTLSPKFEADGSRGTLGISMMSPAEVDS